MRATLSELARHTSEVIRPVIHGGKKVVLTNHGQDVAEIVPLPKVDKAYRRTAVEILRSIGPLELPARK